MDKIEVEKLQSLTHSLERLSTQLGPDHPAVKAIEKQIIALTGAEVPVPPPAAPVDPDKCNCAGCALVEWATTGNLGGYESPFSIYENLWLECEGDAVLFQERFEDALGEAKAKLDNVHPTQKLSAAVRALQLLGLALELDQKYPEIRENLQKAKSQNVHERAVPANLKDLPPEVLAAMPAELREAIANGDVEMRVVKAESPEELARMLDQLKQEGATRH